MKANRLSLILVSLLTGFAFLQAAQAVVPPPDGGYSGNNTAEGQNALLSLTTGVNNTAVGWFSLKSNRRGQLNTAVGAGTLFTMVAASRNTAVGGRRFLATLTARATQRLEPWPSGATPLAT